MLTLSQYMDLGQLRPRWQACCQYRYSPDFNQYWWNCVWANLPVRRRPQVHPRTLLVIGVPGLCLDKLVVHQSTIQEARSRKE